MRKTVDFSQGNMEIELAPNHFEAEDNFIGLFDYVSTEESFLSIQKYTFSLSDDRSAGLQLLLSDQMWTHERQAYTLMMLGGDLGGFISAVYLLPSLMMGYFSQKIFKWAVASAYPVKITAKTNNKA